MRARIWAWGVAILLLVSPRAGAQAPPADPPSITPGEILVLGAPPGRNRTAPYAVTDPGPVESRLRSRGVRADRARPLSPGRNLSAAFPGGAWVVSLEPGADPGLEATRLGADPSVVYAGPNHLIPVVETAGIASDDSLFAKQWALAATRVPEAWTTSSGEGIVVGVVDTGIEADHPDLITQLAVNEAEANGIPGVDDDGNGFVDDVAGYDFTDVPGFPATGDYLERDNDPDDEYSHGTRVAGVIAAARDNGIGIAGVAPDARVLPLRAGFSTTIPGIPALLQEDDIAAAILYAADRGVDILNFSFGDVVNSPMIAHSVRYARARGVLVIAASGNTGSDQSHFPAALPGVVSVGASGRTGFRTGFSTFGQDLDFLAPGENILTTYPGGTYRIATGTSFAAPMAAGVAALVWSAHPELGPDEVAWRLRLSARGASNGWSPDLGWGFLDAAAAVADAPRPPVIQVESLDLRDGVWEVGGTVAHPDLVEWSLSAVPESAMVKMTGFQDEQFLVESARTQGVKELLASWDPGETVAGTWVLRLAATVQGYPVLEERTRIYTGTEAPRARDVRFEFQAGDRGWDAVARWSSPGLDQGALRVSGPTERFATEVHYHRDHGVRIEGPLPVGPARFEILARPSDQIPYTTLAETVLVVPDAIRELRASPVPALPPGTPMDHSVDWDGDGNPEVLVESPPGIRLYGDIFRYEIQPDGSVTQEGSSEFVYQGIPVDAADADGDGFQELVVFNLDRWMVVEADSVNEFPRRFVRNGITDSVPLGYVDTGSRLVLLAVAGNRLELLDPLEAYAETFAAEADQQLTTGYAAGDFDGDGVTEVAVSDLAGNLVLFEVTAGEITLQETLSGAGDLAYSMAAVSSGGAFPDLYTAELDPRLPLTGGDIQIASVKIRRRSWNGSTLAPAGGLALAGMYQKNEVQLLPHEGDLLVRTRGRVDLVTLDAAGPGWGGEVLRSFLSPVDGITRLAGPAGDRVWLGSTRENEGEGFVLAGTGIVGVPARVRVLDVSPASQALRVRLGWDSDSCAPEDSLVRNGNIRGSYPLPRSGRTASDTLALGEQVTYTLYAGPCPPRTLTLLGDAPGTPQVVWEDAENLAVVLNVPMEDSPSGTPVVPDAVWLADSAGRFPPRSFDVVHGGDRILVSVPAGRDPDTLVVVKAWDMNGYPVGGAATSFLHVGPRPAPAVPPVLAEVRYRSENGVPRLEITLGGDVDACSPDFTLSPPASDLGAPTGSGRMLRVILSRPLAAGEYRLSLAGDCVSGLGSPPGTERSFRVGFEIYPNPLRFGQELVVDNLEPGSRVEIHDVTGNERLAFRTESPVDRRRLDALGPGLYFVRVESPDGRFIAIAKLAVIR